MKNMKRIVALVLAMVMMLSLAACGSKSSDDSSANGGSDDTKTYRIALLVPYLGDQSYFDTTNSGLEQLKEKYDNVETQVVEMTTDKSKYNDFFDDVCASGQYDLVVSGGTDAEEALYVACEKYPDQLFMNFDYSDEPPTNCYAVTYSTADEGYLAGYLGSLITTSSMEKANADAKIGVLVGMDLPSMNDFIGGFCEVATENGVQVYIAYPESFSDTAKAKELALEMYEQGCDVIWQVAGSAGTGVFEAAAQVDKYAFGVDSDQTLSIGDASLSATIVTSFFKDCGASIVNAVELLMADQFPAGECRTLGLAENAVGLCDNEQYQSMVPEEIRTAVEEKIEEVKSGAVTVYSVKADPDRWEEVKAAATAAK
jgi:basic membrane protein A